MASSAEQASERRRERPWVVVVADTSRAGQTYRVEAPGRVLRMFGMLSAARDELDLTTVPPEGRARVHRLLEVVSSELERSVSPALAAELHELVGRLEGVPGAAELRIEYASLLGWASGLVVAMLDQLADTRDQLYLTSEAAGAHACDGADTAADAAGAEAFFSGGLLAGAVPGSPLRRCDVRDDEGPRPRGIRPLWTTGDMRRT